MIRTAVIAAFMALAASLVQAAPISPFNDRPESIGVSPASEATLQTILDGFFGSGAIDAADDQSSAGYFKVNAASTSISPQFIIEFTGNSLNNEFGLFSLPGLDDSNPITTVQLFDGSLQPTGGFDRRGSREVDHLDDRLRLACRRTASAGSRSAGSGST